MGERTAAATASLTEIQASASAARTLERFRKIALVVNAAILVAYVLGLLQDRIAALSNGPSSFWGAPACGVIHASRPRVTVRSKRHRRNRQKASARTRKDSARNYSGVSVAGPMLEETSRDSLTGDSERGIDAARVPQAPPGHRPGWSATSACAPAGPTRRTPPGRPKPPALFRTAYTNRLSPAR